MWKKYLQRPVGTLLEDMTYPEYFAVMHQVFTGGGNAIPPPYNEARLDTTVVYPRFE
jgi:hypothetical protein